MAADLAGTGLDVVVAPMLEVHPEPDPVARILDGGPADALVFTSAQAATAVAGDPRLGEILGLPAVAVGPATAAALASTGFRRILDGGGDGASLIARLLRDDTAPAIVHVAGRDMSVDVAASLRAAGRSARTAVVYRADPADTLDAAVAEDLRAGAFDIAVLASRRSAETFRRTLAGAGVSLPLDRPAIVAISAAAAAPLADAFTQIRIAPSPDGAGLVEGIVALAARVAKNGVERRP